MLSVQEARERILNSFHPGEKIVLPLHQGAGRILAEDIHASTDLPPFDNSSVDGFAVRSSDVARANPSHPVRLDVVADIPAGSFSQKALQSGQAARIMTGAPLPAEADAVVMVEDTDFNVRAPGTPAPRSVAIYKPVTAGTSIRRRGDDLHEGVEVLHSGSSLRPQDLGILATLGVARVSVYRKPRLALLSGGDELIPVEAPLSPGKIHDANSIMLSALTEQSGAEVIPLGIAADQLEAVHNALEQAVEAKADLIVSSAGVSVGAFDYVKEAVESAGGLDFWQVDMRPGKPLAFGRYRDVPFIGLPGNPVSAFIGFKIFVIPALEKMNGMPSRASFPMKARLAESIESDGRMSFLRAVVTEQNGTLMAYLTGHQGSGNILSLVQANALLIVPSGVKSLPANSEVDLWWMEK